MRGIEALAGYAIGTIQVLVIDWWRRIAAHKRNLRLLQAELRRMRTFEAKCGWDGGLPPEDEKIPAPPTPTELFVKTVGETEWRLTDEHRDDNTQQALLHILDGCSTLRHYSSKLQEIADRAPFADQTEKAKLREKGEGYATAYDANIDEVLYLIDDALRDIARRLQMTDFFSQLDRVIDGVPVGTNPPGLQPNDPRLDDWKKENRTRLAKLR